MAEKGDMQKFQHYARRMTATWGDPDSLFAADPSAVLKKIKDAMTTRPSRPVTVSPGKAAAL